MITGITIENFKGISEPVHLDLRPITLLFGANSAGKSTLLQSLLLAYEVLVRGNRNPDKTTLGGSYVDLGGFRNFVHKQESDRSVHLRFELDLGSVAFDSEWPIPEKLLTLNQSSMDVSTTGDDIFEAVVELSLSWDRRTNEAFVSRYSVELDGEPFAVIKDDRNSQLFRTDFMTLSVNRCHPVWKLPDGIDDVAGLLDCFVPGLPTLGEQLFQDGTPMSSFDLERLVSESVDVDELSSWEDDAFDSDLDFDEIEERDHGDRDEGDEDDRDSSQTFRDLKPAWTGPVSRCSGFEQLMQVEGITIRIVDVFDHEDTRFRAFLYRSTNGVIGCAAAQFEAEDDDFLVDMPAWCEEMGIPWGFRDRSYLSLPVTLRDALPNWNRELEVDLAQRKNDDAEVKLQSTDLAFAKAILSRLILVPGKALANHLERFRYVGPLRETPLRGHATPRFPDPSRWASGLGAWDALFTGPDELVDNVGEWLGSKDHLNAGCTLRRRNFFEVDSESEAVRRLLRMRPNDDSDNDDEVDLSRINEVTRVVIQPADSPIQLSPSDVGIGISQIVPVIVTAVDGMSRPISIEQPELHVHPRLQAAMADLFIEAIDKYRHTFIVETHSEHLILRLLRRIRETEKGTAPPDRQLRTDELGIYYLKQENGSTTASRIDVDVKGEFIQPWPDDFFEIDFYERFA